MYHIIINPASRSGRGLKIWKEQVEPALRRDGAGYRTYFSGQAGDVAKIANDILSQADASPVSMIVLGGDGTVNEAIQGMTDPSRVILGYIPTGSSNDLARDLGIPTDPTAALDLILHSGTACSMDLGTVTYEDGCRRRFAVSCGIGFDAAVCEEALRSKAKKVLNKIGLGKLTYLSIALKQLFAAKTISGRLILDDKPPVEIGSILFTACMLHRFEGGGFMFSPDADATDGVLNLCAVGDISKALILFALPTAFKGRHYRFNGITPYQAKKVSIEVSSPLWVHTDGEVTRKSRSITVTCKQNALRIIRSQT
ncbi:MAG: diacylglycerol kinase family lipid kinase [Butyrivibrio sp.]|nr:diacylglycerol kinase family lipid kinase [Acetatifactor muris]MCM1561519.1 diacylglycerol kinase family lipid kinase [Butyrivibrio sp.]